MASVKVLLRPYKKNKLGQHAVIIQIIHNRKIRTIFLGHYLKPEEWDPSEGHAIEKSKNKEYKIYLQKLNSTIDDKKSEFKNVIIDLERAGKPYTVDMIVDKLEQPTNYISFFKFTESFISRLEKAGKNGNALAYKNTFGVFKSYRNEKDLSFDELTYKVLINFEEDLQGRGRKVNAISFHMRTLRSIYNKAIKEGIAQQELYPFKDYRVKREKTSKRAIIKGNVTAIKELDLSDELDLDKARDYFLFSFYTRGMAFVDLAFLKVSNIYGDRLTYSRNKTNQKFSIKLTPQISEIIAKYNDLSIKDSYLFPIIIDPKGDIYTQYRNGMRLTNKKLNKIGDKIGLDVPLTTYVSRHSWATIAKREGVPTAVISEGLGHETERTTQIYLDSFENQVLDDANDLITNI